VYIYLQSKNHLGSEFRTATFFQAILCLCQKDAGTETPPWLLLVARGSRRRQYQPSWTVATARPRLRRHLPPYQAVKQRQPPVRHVDGSDLPGEKPPVGIPIMAGRRMHRARPRREHQSHRRPWAKRNRWIISLDGSSRHGACIQAQAFSGARRRAMAAEAGDAARRDGDMACGRGSAREAFALGLPCLIPAVSIGSDGSAYPRGGR
jgi:hypothetical protein